MIKTIIASLILGCVLACAPAAKHAFEITLNADNTMINDPGKGMVLRSFVDPPDERLEQAALQLTYERDGSRFLFNLISITVYQGPVTVGMQREDGSLAVYKDVPAGTWPVRDGSRVDRVTLECPSGASCPSTDSLRTKVRVSALKIQPVPTPYHAYAIGAPGGTVVIDGFTLPDYRFYPDGWCFWGAEAVARFSTDTVELARTGAQDGVPIVCKPGSAGGVPVVPGGGGGGTGDDKGTGTGKDKWPASPKSRRKFRAFWTC